MALNRLVNAHYRRVVNSWLFAALVVLIAYAAAALQLDDYPIYVDGLFSLATAGYADPHPDARLVLERLAVKSQQHVPGYFLLLQVWGNLLAWEPLAMRVLSLFFGVLSLALIYRLGRCLHSRELGAIALVMFASLTAYNIWYLPIRMYTMFVATELLLLWLYFRAQRVESAGRAKLVLLWMACVAFLYTHIFSLATLLGIGAYHVFCQPRNRHWLRIAGAFLLAGVAFLPWLVILIPGTEFAARRAGEWISAFSADQLLLALFSLGANANFLFALLLLLAARLAWRRDPSAIVLGVILLVSLAFYVVVNAATGLMDFPRTRYAVIVFPLMALLMARGLVTLNHRTILILFALLFWLASALLYHRRVGASQFVRSTDTMPVHLIERQLREEWRAGDLLTGWSSGLSFDFESTVYGGVADYYFGQHGVEVDIEHTDCAFETGRRRDYAAFGSTTWTSGDEFGSRTNWTDRPAIDRSGMARYQENSNAAWSMTLWPMFASSCINRPHAAEPLRENRAL